MCHTETQVKNQKVLGVAFVLTFLFALLEVVSSLFLGTLALFSEGIHMLSDGLSLGFGLFAATYGMKMATERNPFGFRRIESIAAFLNGLALLVIPLYVCYEAVVRLLNPRTILSKEMLMVATIGLVINLIVAFTLHKGSKDNVNIKAASLHVLADLFSSVSVIIASLLIMTLNWAWIDPVVSAVVAVVIFIGGIKITREAFHILMEGTPNQFDTEKWKTEWEKDGFVVSELRVWAITTGVYHATVKGKVQQESDLEKTRTTLHQAMREKNIQATIELTT